jgi:hypothetical protein
MAELESEYFSLEHHWRKSSQWSILNREHADLVAADQHVMELFRRHCYTVENEWRWQMCISDEHAVPSILASYGLDNQTDCLGESHHTEWPGGTHPRAFEKGEDITLEWLGQWRHEEHGCNAAAAMSTAQQLFYATANHASGSASDSQNVSSTDGSLVAVSAGGYAGYVTPSRAGLVPNVYGMPGFSSEINRGTKLQSTGKEQIVKKGYQKLGYECPLFVRKVTAPAANATLALSLSCQGLGLASWCR